MTFSLLSEARRATTAREGKPETIVVVETDGIRERKLHEQVHLGREEGDICNACAITICGCGEGTWTDSAELHARHPARCSS